MWTLDIGKNYYYRSVGKEMPILFKKKGKKKFIVITSCLFFILFSLDLNYISIICLFLTISTQSNLSLCNSTGNECQSLLFSHILYCSLLKRNRWTICPNDEEVGWKEALVSWWFISFGQKEI